MLRRFSSGMVPLKCKKQAQLVPAFVTTFRRANLSLASCTSAELASVLVQNNIQRIKLYLQTVEKSSHVQGGGDYLFGMCFIAALGLKIL